MKVKTASLKQVRVRPSYEEPASASIHPGRTRGTRVSRLLPVLVSAFCSNAVMWWSVYYLDACACSRVSS